MTDALLTLSEVRAWERRDEEIGTEVGRLLIERQELRRKLEAARVFMPEAVETQESVIHDDHPAAPATGEESLSDAVLVAVAELDGSATPGQIRRRIANTNQALGAKLAASPNYFYTVLGRHLHRNRLVKDGNGYRLPSVSAQAETEAVAASAPSQPTSQSMEAGYDGPKGNGLL